jgi:hypothetical protein
MKIFRIFILTFPLLSSASELDIEWYNMQVIYKILKKNPVDQQYVLPIWRKFSRALESLINDPINYCFLMHPSISPPMLRIGFGNTTQFELNYLNNCLSLKNKNLLSLYQDVSIGGLPLDCPGKKCSVNTIGQMFYLGKILEQIDYESIDTFVEFGGGYGSLARITKSLLPNVSYVIIDLPELLAIQYLYLKTSLSNQTIVIYTPGNLVKGAINLVPVSILKDLNLKATVFASNFALSESPFSTQELLINKNFFNADVCYINGQVDSWGTNNSWQMPSHLIVIDTIKKLYKHTYTQPHHIFDGAVCSYEIIGVK